MAKLYFEDFQVGDVTEYREATVSKQEIIEFGEKYDPQPIHIDEEKAADSQHGSLIASGLMIIGVANRLIIQGFQDTLALVAGLGMDNIRLQNTVHPGDTLFVRRETTNKRKSKSNPKTGIVESTNTVYNQQNVKVMEYSESILLECKEC